jgi:hypothetical protein
VVLLLIRSRHTFRINVLRHFLRAVHLPDHQAHQ